jgi:hypothetical protein
VCGPRALPDPPRGLEGGGRTRSGLTGCLRRRGSVPSAAAVRRWHRPAARRRCGGEERGAGELEEGEERVGRRWWCADGLLGAPAAERR